MSRPPLPPRRPPDKRLCPNCGAVLRKKFVILPWYYCERCGYGR